jgi:hypothetical protein
MNTNAQRLAAVEKISRDLATRLAEVIDLRDRLRKAQLSNADQYENAAPRRTADKLIRSVQARRQIG